MTATTSTKERGQIEIGIIEARIAEMKEHWNTDEILQELGRLVPEYHVVTVKMVDGSHAYGISCEIDGPSFQFLVAGSPYHLTLRKAALFAMQGVLAFNGSDS